MSPERTIDPPEPSQFSFALPVELLDYFPNALAILALDGTVRVVNRAALKLLSFHSSEIIGRHFGFFLHSLDPPLLVGGFQKLLEVGNASFNVALRCGGDHFIQVEIHLTVFYDDQAQPSGVLVMSREGDEQHLLIRQAVAKVADQVSQLIAYASSDEDAWSRLFALCQELFDTPGGWLSLHRPDELHYIPYTFGAMYEQPDWPCAGMTFTDCPCIGVFEGESDPCAVNSMNCPLLTPTFDSGDPDLRPLHHGVAPILNANGERIADICLMAPAGRIFHHHELALMDAMADQVGQALERGEIGFPAAPASPDRFAVIQGQDVAPALLEVLEQILRDLAALVPYVSAGIFLQERDGLRLMAAVNHPQAQDLRGQLFPYSDDALHQEIVRTRSPVILEDVRQNPHFQSWGGLDYIRGWMGLPLVVNDAVIGIITVDSDQVGGFSQRDGVVAQAFAGQAAIAVEKARLADELRQGKRNLELLNRLSQSLVVSLEPEAVADKALELITAIFNDCFGEIYVAENGQERLHLLATRNHPPRVVEKLHSQPYLRTGVGIVSTSIEMRRPVLVPNVFEDPRWVRIPDLGLTVRSVASAPLIARNEMVGALVLGSPELGVFSHRYLSLLQSIAAPVALALQNARLFVAERGRRQEAEMLHDATGALTLDLRVEQILRILLERLRKVVYFDSACVMLWEGKDLHLMAEIGLSRSDEALVRRFPAEKSFFADIQRARRAIFFDDVQKLPRWSGWGGASTTRSWMGVPLIHRGDVLGYITLDSLQVDRYGEKEASLAQAFANQVTTTLVNAQLLQDSQRAMFEQLEMSAILRDLNGATSLADIQAAVAEGLHRLIGPEAIEIGLYQLDEQKVTAERTIWAGGERGESAGCTYRMGESSVVFALLSGRSHTSIELAEESEQPIEQEWVAQGFHARIALALRSGDRVIGHIQLLWRDQLEPAQAIHFSLPQIADAVAIAAEKIALLQNATRRADELQRLADLSRALRTVEDRESITETFLSVCLRVLQADQGYVLVPSAAGDALEVIAQIGRSPLGPILRFGYNDSIVGRVFRSGEPYGAADLFNDPLVHRQTLQNWIEAGITFASGIYAPLRSGAQVIGVVCLRNTETHHAFSPSDLRLLNVFAEIAGYALHRAKI